MKSSRLLVTLLAISCAHASESQFSVNDDVLAYPQYAIIFSDSYVTYEEASKRLGRADNYKSPIPLHEGDTSSQLARLNENDEDSLGTDGGYVSNEDGDFHHLILHGRPYLCSIPQVNRSLEVKPEEKMSEADQEKELVRAADRGWKLLQGMEGKPCLFFSTGWWSYSFCYNSQVKQFHSLPAGANGGPLWPPTEDPSTPSYVLGKFEPNRRPEDIALDDESTRHEVTELQTKSETRYLVQRLGGGTPCDLTGKDRRIEVQFHCHPQSTDRIGWIKETTTCAYLMVVYTPRLCNDVAFLPPKETRANSISCRAVLKPDQIEDWEARRIVDAHRQLLDQGSEQRVVVGDVEVGAMKDVGRDGRRIERGRVVLTPEEKAEIVAMQKDGQIQGLSRAELKKLDLNPEDVDAFRKELQKLAGTKDWKIERLDDVNGHIQLRGVVASDSGSKNVNKNEEGSDDEGEEKKEVYKEEG